MSAATANQKKVTLCYLDLEVNIYRDFSWTENGTFFCNECDSKFADDEALKQHMLQVHSDKPYKCDRCQAAFRYKGNLASHKTVHTGTPTSYIYINFLHLRDECTLCSFTLLCWSAFLWFFYLQERSRIAVISVVLSLTDQLTSRLTLASTQERSHTNVRRAELVLYR